MKKQLMFLLSVILVFTFSFSASATTTTSGYTDTDTIDVSLTADILEQDGEVVLNWTKYTGDDLRYYKVMYSQDKVDMVYPEDSYVAYFTDNDVTEYTADLNDGVNYFRICVLTEAEMRACGNTVTVDYQATDVEKEENEVSDFDSNLSAALSGTTVTLTWDEYDGEGFTGYKVVRSSSNATPSYPNDGYLSYITDRSKTTYLDSDVQKGDNYYRICALDGGDVVCGNVVLLISDVDGSVNEETDDIYTDDSDIDITLEASLDEDKVRLSWTEYDGSGFKWYKIVHSTSNPGLYYPEDGYLEVYTNAGITSYVDKKPHSGVNYYRICVITDDNRRGCSNVETVDFEGDYMPFSSYFSDMKDHWASEYVSNLAADGVVNGVDGNFMPDEKVIRVDALKMILYAFDKEGTSCDPDLFPDMNEGDWYCDVVTYAYKKNVIKGDNGYLMPVRNLTRAEAVKILIRVTGDELPIMYSSDFSDVSDDDWFAAYVELARRQGYIKGYEDGTFRPYQNITRAELAKIISKAQDKNL